MFELFTTRARKVLELAKTEGKRNGDDMLGTQHILFGLAKEGSGIAHHILENNGVSSLMIVKEADKVVQKGSGATENPIWTPRSIAIFGLAVDIAKELGHNYVGTEHLLLGLLKEANGIACQILINFGLNIEQIRKETLQLLGFYDKDYFLEQVGEHQVYTLICRDSTGKETIGRYDAESDSLFLNRPFTIEDIQQIIATIRRIQSDKK